MTQPPRVTVGTRASIAADVVARLSELARSAIEARGQFALAIPGGSVAEAILPVLANEDLPWSATHIFWVDERAVPITSADSNAGRAMELWRGSRLERQAALHVMPADREDLARAADEYAAVMERVLGTPPVLDVVLLGVGEDGHVASLFPGKPEMTRTDVSVLPVYDSPKSPARRLTVSMPLLTNAREMIVVALGASKLEVMRRVLNEQHAALPVEKLVASKRERALVMTDLGLLELP